ncbi:MAG: hypothetical protein AAFY42_13340 [Pseudomonadota bacterium]
MSKWEAIAEIVKSFNARGSPAMALASVAVVVLIPSCVIAFGIWMGAPEIAGALANLIE